MEVTEKLARYIIYLQCFKEAELGFDENDTKILHQIETEFPQIKKEHEETAFDDWVWTIKIEQSPKINEFRKTFHRLHVDEFNKLLPKFDSLKQKLYNDILSNKEKYWKEFKVYQAIQTLTKSKKNGE